GEARHRRDVHRSRPGSGESGAHRSAQAGPAVSAAVEHSRDRDSDSSARGEAGVRFRPGSRRAPNRHGLVHSPPCLQGGISGRSGKRNKGGLITLKSRKALVISVTRASRTRNARQQRNRGLAAKASATQSTRTGDYWLCGRLRFGGRLRIALVIGLASKLEERS